MVKHGPSPKDDQWSEEDVARVLANPAHVANGTVTREQWVQAAVRMAEDQGTEACIQRILLVFDESLDGQGRIEARLNRPELIQDLLEREAKFGRESTFAALLEGLLEIGDQIAGQHRDEQSEG
ncbi:MAG: hypothetical protein BIFFINMI_00597 [Phycisphaerae bacterium]|nr:hypothetical protein [Phycisphaerae bacterium]